MHWYRLNVAFLKPTNGPTMGNPKREREREEGRQREGRGKAEREAEEARKVRKAIKEEKARLAAEVQAAKEMARKFRARRSAAFKSNVDKFGLAKAKFIANLITSK